MNNPAVIGSWESVDFVSDPAEFSPAERKWHGDLLLKGLDFQARGMLGNQKTASWTKGMILSRDAKTASAYQIKEIDGKKYMFYEWKSGDYTAMHRQPHYYVLRQKPADSPAEKP